MASRQLARWLIVGWLVGGPAAVAAASPVRSHSECSSTATVTFTFAPIPSTGFDRVSFGGATGRLSVSTEPGCSWTVSASQSGARIPSSVVDGISFFNQHLPLQGTGFFLTPFEIARNPSQLERQFVLYLNGVPFQTIVQEGTPCTFEVAPRTLYFGSAASTQQIDVTAWATDCPWTAVADVPWISVAAPEVGSGVVSVSVTPHLATGAASVRRGVVTVAGTAVTVAQESKRSALVTITGAAGDGFVYNRNTGAWALVTNNIDLPTHPYTTIATVAGAGIWATGWDLYPADFDGDGRTDLLFYNPVTGVFVKGFRDTADWFRFFGYAWAPGWTPTIGDYNGDGRSDVFLYNRSSGRWFMCVSVTGQDDFHYTPGLWAPGWKIAPADFDGDGRTDLFLYNNNPSPDPNTGRWFRVMAQPDASFAYVQGDVRWGIGWSIVTADFDADNRSDLFLYDRVNGAWFAVQFTATSAQYSGGLWAPGWNLYEADFDGDARSDLFLYNPDNGRWFVAITVSPGQFRYTTGLWATGWTISATDWNLDGLADLVLYNAVTGFWYLAATTTPGHFAYSNSLFYDVPILWPTGGTLIMNGRR